MQIPNSDLPSKAARSKNIIAMRVEGNAPGCSRMSRESADALVGSQICHIDVVITMRGSHFRSVIKTVI